MMVYLVIRPNLWYAPLGFATVCRRRAALLPDQPRVAATRAALPVRSHQPHQFWTRVPGAATAAASQPPIARRPRPIAGPRCQAGRPGLAARPGGSVTRPATGFAPVGLVSIVGCAPERYERYRPQHAVGLYSRSCRKMMSVFVFSLRIDHRPPWPRVSQAPPKDPNN